MTGSRSEPAVRRIVVVGTAMLLASACRAGLPPEPPGADAADPDAEVSAYDPGPDPLRRSAFEGVDADDNGGNAHHHHGHGKPQDVPAPSEPEASGPGHRHDEGDS